MCVLGLLRPSLGLHSNSRHGRHAAGASMQSMEAFCVRLSWVCHGGRWPLPRGHSPSSYCFSCISWPHNRCACLLCTMLYFRGVTVGMRNGSKFACSRSGAPDLVSVTPRGHSAGLFHLQLALPICCSTRSICRRFTGHALAHIEKRAAGCSPGRFNTAVGGIAASPLALYRVCASSMLLGGAPCQSPGPSCVAHLRLRRPIPAVPPTWQSTLRSAKCSFQKAPCKSE